MYRQLLETLVEDLGMERQKAIKSIVSNLKLLRFMRKHRNIMMTLAHSIAKNNYPPT
jgi:hypothetical protein